MPHPKHRRTSSDRKRRASHFALKKVQFGTCQKCKEPVRPHYACANCGTYSGRETVDMSRTTARAVAKVQSRADQKAETTTSEKPVKEKKEVKSGKVEKVESEKPEKSAKE
jgi:large subunit ribosomal protein L32